MADLNYSKTRNSNFRNSHQSGQKQKRERERENGRQPEAFDRQFEIIVPFPLLFFFLLLPNIPRIRFSSFPFSCYSFVCCVMPRKSLSRPVPFISLQQTVCPTRPQEKNVRYGQRARETDEGQTRNVSPLDRKENEKRIRFTNTHTHTDKHKHRIRRRRKKIMAQSLASEHIHF